MRTLLSSPRHAKTMISIIMLILACSLANAANPKPLVTLFQAGALPGCPTLQSSDSAVMYYVDKGFIDASGVNVVAQDAKDFLDAQPAGKRTMFMWHMEDPLYKDTSDVVLDASWNPVVPTVRGPYRTNAANSMKSVFQSFLQAYYALGGQLDYIIQDYEGGMPMSDLTSANLTAIQNDPRFTAQVQPLLGFSDLQLVLDTGQPQYRIKWDAMVMKRISEYLEFAYFDVAQALYPNVKNSNWLFQDFCSAPLGVPFCEGTRFYEWVDGFHTGTHSAPAVYGDFWPRFSLNPPDGAPNPYPLTAYNGVRADINNVRQCANVPGVPFQPTYAWYNYNKMLIPYNLYQEEFFHVGLADPSELIFWDAYDTLLSTDPDDETTGRDQKIFYDLLGELNTLVGFDDKVSLTNGSLVPWTSTYFLSGMNADGRSVWRFTPNFEAVSGMTMEGVLAQSSPVKFQVGDTLISFASGSQIYTPADPTLAPGGFWVTAGLSGTPTVTTNARPTVTLTAPADWSTYASNASVTLSATASAVSGTLTKVDFYDGSTLLYSDNAAPYSYNWASGSAGDHLLTAKAYNSGGSVTTSNVVHITRNIGGDGVTGAYYDVENWTDLKVTRVDPMIAFWWDQALPDPSLTDQDYWSVRWTGYIRPKYTETYTFTLYHISTGAKLWVNNQAVVENWEMWGASASGTIALEAGKLYPIRLDYMTLWGNAWSYLYWQSASQAYEVVPQSQLYSANTPPTVSMTGPDDGTILQLASNSTTLTATASDPDGTVSKVEFYDGANKVGEDTTAPYSCAWSGISAGSHTVTAKAYDNFDGVTTSASISIKVNQPPTIQITYPVSGTAFRNAFGFAAHAHEAEDSGKIRKVVYYIDGNKYYRGYGDNVCYPFPNQDDPAGLAHEADYYTWAGWLLGSGAFNQQPGVHTIRAEAYDLDGGVGVAETTFVWVTTGQGLKGEYFGSSNFGDLKVIRTDTNVDFSWGPSAPDASIPADNFCARWTGYLLPKNTSNQAYTFYVQGDDGIKLWLNDQLIIDAWGGASTETASSGITLNDGQLYNIKMEFKEDAGNASAFLRWSAPGVTKEIIPATQFYLPYGGITGRYYDSDNFTNLVSTRTDPNVAFWWDQNLPDPAITDQDYWSVRWTGYIRPKYTETYTFSLHHTATGGKLWIGDQELIEDWNIWATYDPTGTIALQAGKVYPIRLDYNTLWGNAWAFLMWQSASQAYEIVPQDCLFPGNSYPSVSITAPTPGQIFSQPANVTINASAFDLDGTISSVAFYEDGSLLGTDSGSPYSFAWNDAPQGTHILTAVATDDSGAISTSSGVSILVGGLLGHWKFDEGTGSTTTDSSVYGQTATLRGSPSWVTQGAINKALSFDGTNDVQIGNPSHLNFTGPLTISAWIRCDNYNGYHVAVGHGFLYNPNANGVILRIDNGWYAFGTYVNGMYHLVWGEIPQGDKDIWAGGGYVHVVGTYDGTALRVYSDGVLRGGPVNESGPILLNADWTIGSANGYQTFVGSVDDVRIYNTALSVDEIQTLAAETASADYVAVDTTTQGNWKNVFGANGHNVIADHEGYPDYAVVSVTNNSTWTWDSNPTDVRGLQRYTTGRIAACWYAGTDFTVDINLIDGQQHQVAFYCLDWDNLGRQQTVEVYAAADNTLLDSRSLSSFGTVGKYLVWNLKGHVKVKFINTGPDNAVLSGIFFDPLNTAPTVSITSPSSGAVYQPGADITINASASDTIGTVVKTEFYEDGNLIGTDTGSPYSCIWSGAPIGTHLLTAKAYDNLGANTTSSSVSVRVNNPPSVSVTSPASGASYVAPASIAVSANASDTDGTISQVEFFDGANSLGVDNSSPYSVTWNSPSAGVHSLTAKATDSDGALVTSSAVSVTVWGSQDIGTVGQTGSASLSGTVFTETGAGAGITSTADAFRFVYLPTTGDCTIVARVASFGSTSQTNNRAGVMMRQSLDANAIEASSLYRNYNNAYRVYLHYRTSAGGSTNTSSYGTAAAAPYWVKLVRNGNTLSAWRSSNGTSWTQVGSNTTVTMTGTIYIGLAATSGTTASTKTATFDNVSITYP